MSLFIDLLAPPCLKVKFNCRSTKSKKLQVHITMNLSKSCNLINVRGRPSINDVTHFLRFLTILLNRLKWSTNGVPNTSRLPNYQKALHTLCITPYTIMTMANFKQIFINGPSVQWACK